MSKKVANKEKDVVKKERMVTKKVRCNKITALVYSEKLDKVTEVDFTVPKQRSDKKTKEELEKMVNEAGYDLVKYKVKELLNMVYGMKYSDFMEQAEIVSDEQIDTEDSTAKEVDNE